MQRSVEFLSDLFESEIVPDSIDDYCFGEDLANWLIEKLHASSFKFNALYQEDWGWQIEVKLGNNIFLISIGNRGKLADFASAKWNITIELERSWFSFGNVNSALLQELCDNIDAILRSEERITSIHWQDS